MHARCRTRILSSFVFLTIISTAALVYALYGPPFVMGFEPRFSPEAYQSLLRSVHVVLFTLWTPAWIAFWRTVAGRWWGIPHVAVPVVAAILSEILQLWIPGHVANLVGAEASLGGVAVGLLLTAFYGFWPISFGMRPGDDYKRDYTV